MSRKKQGQPELLESVYQTINAIFPDKGIMRRIAKAESNEGKAPGTHRPGYYGGVFQVDRIAFDDIQAQIAQNDKHFIKQSQRIQDKLGIDISQAHWEDLNYNPLLSGLFGRLELSRFAESIPDSVEGQAKYWKKYYNKSGAGTEKHFMDAQ